MASVGQERRHSQTMNTAALAVFDCEGIIGISMPKVHTFSQLFSHEIFYKNNCLGGPAGLGVPCYISHRTNNKGTPMKLTTKQYVKKQVREYLNKQHPEMSPTRIERIAQHHSAHPLTTGFNDEDLSTVVDMDAVVCQWYHSLTLCGVPCEEFERSIPKTLRETKKVAA